MGRMADTVLKKSNAAEKEVEARVLHYAEERYKKQAHDEKEKQEMKKSKQIDINKMLER